MKILIAGAAGFIGYHLTNKLIKTKHKIFGIDNLNNYYDVKLKKARLKELLKHKNFNFFKLDLTNKKKLDKIFKKFKFNMIINLAAQAGVRYSIENPKAYIQSNIVGFSNILEGCRKLNVENLLYASSSSVYGGNTLLPFSEDHGIDHPVSLYAASKKSNELMAHTYSHLYGIPCTGLRFFTVYGPWGRPDMALFKFTKAILDEKPIDVYNNGEHSRDFTYIDDILNGVIKVLKAAISTMSISHHRENASIKIRIYWCT